MMPTLLSVETLESDRQFVERKRNEDASPWGTARLMWEQRLREIDEKIEEAKTKRSSYASVALIFDGLPVVGQGDIRLDFTTDALGSYQKVIAAALASQNDQPVGKKGRTKGAEKSKLFIRDIVRGSMGFILEELAAPQEDMFDTPLKSAVEKATALIASLNQASEDQFNAAIEDVSPRLVGALQKFTKVLRDAGATTRIVGDVNRVALGLEEIHRLSLRFSEVEITEEEMLLEGVLLGMLPESHEFELELADGHGTLKGTVTDEVTVKYVSDHAFKEQLLLRPVVTLIKFTRSIRNGQVVKQQATLENVEPRTDIDLLTLG